MGFRKPAYAKSKKVDKLDKRFHELKREYEPFSEINEKYKALFERNIH